jgi:hypothetical protein
MDSLEGLPMSSFWFYSEKSRPIFKAKKAKIIEAIPLSSYHNDLFTPFFLRSQDYWGKYLQFRHWTSDVRHQTLDTQN